MTPRTFALRKSLSLKTRLGIGAAVLGAGTLLTALILYNGLNEVAKRLDTALASETRMVRYATLSQQAATFLVVATEVVQTNQSTEIRNDRITPVINQLSRTFIAIRADTQAAVEQARDLGLDAQSRYGTQSLGLARMEAMLANTVGGLRTDTNDTDKLRAYIDNFATAFDPLLNQAVNTERLFRNAILGDIEGLRRTLSLTAAMIAVVTLLLVTGFYFGLVRPQFARLDGLRRAAHRIGQEDFSVSLDVTRMDEIGQLSSETNRMAAALSQRKNRIQAEAERLNETIAERTDALRAANTKLEKIDENRRRFFADVSHELRTPLTVILMEAQIGRQATPEAATAFTTIETRTSRLNRRIDDLLRVARSDSGQLELTPEPTALKILITGVTEEIQGEIDSAGMVLDVQGLDTLSNTTMVHCDQNWVRQVLVSLIRNTIRHARDGGIVQLHIDLQDNTVTFSIIDNGPGIAPNQQQAIFDRFVKGNGISKDGGFGVGLALARWVIETQNGTITLTSPLPRDQAIGDAPGTKVAVHLTLETIKVAP